MRSSLLAVCCVVGCLVAVSVCRPSVGQAVPTSSKRAAWEYKIVSLKGLVDLKGRRVNVFDPDPKLEQELNAEVEAALDALGAEGWELSLEVNGGLVFKRPR